MGQVSSSPEIEAIEGYQYSPLNRASREIRLIRIANNEEIQHIVRAPTLGIIPEDLCRQIKVTVPICCEIKHISLEEKPLYVAISYMWGDERDRQPVVIQTKNGDRKLWVTKSLHQALHGLAFFPNGPYFWIDGICINQADLEEKSWQVQEMYDIYQGANYVAAWLGPADAETTKLFKALNKKGKEWRKIWNDKSVELSEFEALLILVDDEFPSPKALQQFIQTPYWSRIWVQQELRAAQNLWIHSGTSRVYVSNLLALVSIIIKVKGLMAGRSVIKLPKAMLALLQGIRDPDIFLIWRTLSRSMIEEPECLVHILGSLHVAFKQQMKSSDKRDMVYALLGMASDAAELNIIPNYSHSVSKVYVDAASALLRQNIVALLFVNLGSSELDLPSWVPDWSQPFHEVEYYGAPGLRWSTAAGTSQRCTFTLSLARCPVLLLSAVKVDTVIEIEDQLEPLTPPKSLLRRVSRIMEWVTPLRKVRSAYKTPRGRRQAIWATATMGSRFAASGSLEINPDPIPPYTLFRLSNDIRHLAKDKRKRRLWHDRHLNRVRTMRECTMKRKFFVTLRGYLGLGTHTVEGGDLIIIALGLDLPIIIRPTNDGFYRLVGSAYVHGIMNGEFFEKCREVKQFQIL